MYLAASILIHVLLKGGGFSMIILIFTLEGWWVELSSWATQCKTVCRGPHNVALHGAQPLLTHEGHSGHKSLLKHSSFEYRWLI
jgi:hypothetical protein